MRILPALSKHLLHSISLTAALAGCADLELDEPTDSDAPELTPADDDAAPVDDFGGDTGACEPGEERCAGRVPPHLDNTRNLRSTGKRTRGSNSQLAIPQNITLADVNADGSSDFVQLAANKIFVSKTDYARTGLMHTYLRRPIKRVITGDFHGDRNDQLCAIQDDNALVCYGISADRKELWWWFTQGAFVADTDDLIVGDYDGDGRDDILIHPSGGGAFRMYSMKTDYYFNPTPSYDQGNLAWSSGAGMQVRAGDFNGDGRDDVAAVHPALDLVVYLSRWDGVRNTFARSFGTSTYFVGSNDQVTIARINNDAVDDVVLHNRVNGNTRFYRAEPYGPGLRTFPDVEVVNGQISTTANSLVFWGSMHGGLTETGAANRDDAMVYELGWNGFVRSDARWDGSRLTYWWAYSQYAPSNHTGWAPLTSKRGLIVRCKHSDLATEPPTAQFVRDRMLNGQSVANQWQELSYGSWDLFDPNLVEATRTMSLTNASNPGRLAIAQACVSAHGLSASGYAYVLAVVNGQGDSSSQGQYLIMNNHPFTHSVSYLAHEVAHTLGWGFHSFGDDGVEYNDRWDLMSAMNIWTFSNWLGVPAGPEMNAAYKTRGGFIPAARITRLVSTATPQTARLSIAAINRPEANGALMVRIGSDDSNYYTIEYRMKAGYDLGIPRTAVLVHRVTSGLSYLITTGSGAERLAGTSMTFPLAGRTVTVAVNSFATEGFTADVSVTY